MYNPHDSEKYPKRKNPRLQGYDYSTEGCYFVTICTWNKHWIFGRLQEDHPFKHIAQKAVEKIPIHHKGVKIDHYVVMPNHVHMLITISGGMSRLDIVIGSFKASVTRQIHKIKPDIQIWQPSFHDHIVRNEKSYQNIWLYIDSNPDNWEKDCFYTEKS